MWRTVARSVDAVSYLAGIWALGYYREGVRDLLRTLKYRREKSVLPYLHGMLAAGEAVLIRLPEQIVAVPVPLAPARAHERGFNQTELIFAPWLKAHGIAFESLLVRSRVCADGAQIAGRHILLLDDIMTTGTTLLECARTLKRAGAENIYALVLASEHS